MPFVVPVSWSRLLSGSAAVRVKTTSAFVRAVATIAPVSLRYTQTWAFSMPLQIPGAQYSGSMFSHTLLPSIAVMAPSERPMPEGLWPYSASSSLRIPWLARFASSTRPNAFLNAFVELTDFASAPIAIWLGISPSEPSICASLVVIAIAAFRLNAPAVEAGPPYVYPCSSPTMTGWWYLSPTFSVSERSPRSRWRTAVSGTRFLTPSGYACWKMPFSCATVTCWAMRYSERKAVQSLSRSGSGPTPRPTLLHGEPVLTPGGVRLSVARALPTQDHEPSTRGPWARVKD